MKVILRIFVPLCIFSFIAFGISVAVLGRESSSAEGAVNELSLSSEQKTYEINESFTEIRADIGAYKLNIKPWDNDTTKIVATGNDLGRVKVMASGSVLDITTEWKWDGEWFRNLFSGNAFNTQLEVFVPDKVYDALDLHVGAGDLTSDGIKSGHVSLDVSAGKLSYTQPEGHRADFISFDVSAGNLIANNSAADAYTINVSAGNADINGLTGEGQIDVSAGKAGVQYAAVDGNCEVDVSAGDVNLDIPEDASAKFVCSKSAGDIRIMAGGENTTADDGDKFSINGGRYTFLLDVSAGDIRVVNSTASAVEVTSADEVVAATSLYQSDVESPEEVTAAFEESE